MYFGKYSVITPVEHRFEKEPDWYWRFKPTTSADEIKMSQFMMMPRYITLPDGTKRESSPTWVEIAYREIALSFGGTNIPVSEKDNTPVLDDDAGINEVEVILKEMSTDLIAEIWKALGEANPLWGPRLPRQEKIEKESSES